MLKQTLFYNTFRAVSILCLEKEHTVRVYTKIQEVTHTNFHWILCESLQCLVALILKIIMEWY